MVFRPDSPTELPDGRLVCGDHGLVICPMCCVDYTFMDEILADNLTDSDEDLDDEAENPQLGGDQKAQGPDMIINPHSPRNDGFHDIRVPRIGTGRVLFEKFVPPNAGVSPSWLFTPGIAARAMPQATRFINRNDSSQLLIYTDGACLDNGQQNPRAGCAFVFRPQVPPVVAGYSSFRLENKGPTGEPHTQTSNRAELRAVIGALRFRYWKGEGFDTLVIATDSEYVVEGATNWVRGWLRRDWKTSTGTSVKNKDLWQALLGEAERFSDRDMKVVFWRILREQNTLADRHAKEAATTQEVNTYKESMGILV